MVSKKIYYKQELNGKIGHDLTEALLLQRFFVSRRIPDAEGADFLVQKKEETLDNLRESKERINVFGIIQSKFFENQNEVILRKDYVIDNNGPIPEFFVSIYTINNNNQIHYFFSAKEIVKNWKYSDRKIGEYFVFRLTKDNDFKKFKNIDKGLILNIIEEAIEKTEEYRNQQFIQRIIGESNNSFEDVFQNSNLKLFNYIKEKHIVDKLFISLNTFKDFRRIIPWRLVDKISFRENEKKQTSTFYNLFTLITNNNEIINFFKSIKIEAEISITNKDFFKGVLNYEKKINDIIEILNKNLIHNFNGGNDNCFSISKPNSLANIDESYNQLKFNFVAKQISSKNFLMNTVWDKMHKAYLYFDIGYFEKAYDLFEKVSKEAKEQKKYIVEFLALYNIKLTGRKIWKEQRPLLENILANLPVDSEKKEIMRGISEDQTLSFYEKTIDEIFLKIRDYKQRKVVNNSLRLFHNMYAKYLEFSNFYEGNFLVSNIYNDSNTLAEKIVESAIISFSMKTEHTYHLESFNDVLVHLSVHSCQSGNLLKFFQRNNVNKIKYNSENNFFQKCLRNFFSKHNIDFLAKEICYINGKSKNFHLRNKVVNIFSNLCYLMAYLDTKINNQLLKKITYFLDKLDFNVYEVSSLAHPLLKKPKLFPENDILYLTQLLSQNISSSGYLLTNCLYTLNLNSFKFISEHDSLVENIVSAALKGPQYRILRVLPKLLNGKKRKELADRINDSLGKKFNQDLYYEAVINNILPEPIQYLNIYLEFYKNLPKKLNTKSTFHTRSPYTGIEEILSQNLNQLVDIILSINDDKLKENKIINEVINYHQYYKFILNIDNFKEDDEFNKDWILENQSEIVITKLSKNKNFKYVLEKELSKQYNNQICQLYLKHFT